MSNTNIQKLYGSLIQEHGESFQANGYTPYGFRLLRKLYKYVLRQKLPAVARSRPVTILDSGCGNGIMGAIFRENLQISTLVGIDCVAKACQIAESVHGYNHTVVGDVSNLPQLTSDRFDIVNSCGVFPHIPPDKRQAFWSAHAAILKPGGWIIFAIQNLGSFFRKLKPRSKTDPLSKTYGYAFDLDTIRNDLIYLPQFRTLSVSGIDMISGRTFDLSMNEHARLKRLLAFDIAIVVENDPPPVRTPLSMSIISAAWRGRKTPTPEDILYCSSGTEALHLLLSYLRDAIGCKRILLSPFTCESILEAVMASRLQPIFVDFKNDSFIIDAEDLRRKAVPGGKDIMLFTHLFGFSRGMPR